MNLKPIGNNIVIELVEIEEKTSSGIVLPNSVKEKPSIAKVIAVGEGILKDDEKKNLVKVGDKIVYSKYAGNEVKLDKNSYIIVTINDILAVVEE